MTRVRYLPTPSPRIGVTLADTEHALSIRDAAELATAIFVVVGARGGAQHNNQNGDASCKT